ncbi:hypothetical protein PG993_002049 [Apiospora rasikravindrae]|uniref:FAD dependent oxidoreductase domain-containing protein n=1 Tax=Apiospora rasikravindrae TaxID=990691 RepID=A0ABR1UD50_9PEZI
MGGGEAIPGFPHPNPVTSYWQLPPHPIADHRTTADLPTSTHWDYVIIGSGITSAAVAYKLLTRDPALKILMLEARTAASAASGRNGGQVRAGWHLNFAKYADAFGEDVALAFERFEVQNVADMAAFVREHGVDCDFRDVQTADAYTTPAAWTAALAVVRKRQEVERRRPGAGGPFVERRVWEGEAARARVGLPSAVGVITYAAHTQNPYRLVCRMLELGLEKGLNLQTNTMALKVAPLEGSDDKTTAKWEVVTDRGTVKSQKVVLATNGYTNALHAKLNHTGFLVPGRSQLSAIRPGSNMAHHPVMEDTSVGLNDIGNGDYFMVRDADLPGAGDMLYGGGRSVAKSLHTVDDSVLNEKVVAYLKHTGRKVFGSETWGEEGEAVRDWGGITCYTPDTFPLVGEDTTTPGQNGLWMSVGMNGHGMALALRCAEALVEMMTTGKAPEWLPEPFRLERVWNKETVHLSGLGAWVSV